MRAHQARMPLWGHQAWLGPFFQSEICRLHKGLYGPQLYTFTACLLYEKMERLESFHQLASNVRTSDGYQWPLGAQFKLYDGDVLILFPAANDIAYQDNTTSDRHTAMYFTEGLHPYPREVDMLLACLLEIWKPTRVKRTRR